MFSSADNFVLQILSQVVKIIAVTGYTDDKIPVSLRMSLGFFQSVCRYDIELDMVSVHAEVAANQGCEFSDCLLAVEKIR